ncbi:transglycosylase domain-containing protein [Paenibacillus senegalensis]|uniref:transglycosylase domain-containing protein n=1 Tax=Paenibacillus senegalensis TaxID=1465766 RepID=UPI000287AF91|nr:PBP1A family penicillin-binding protein [Paenibacillus senegalensis]
MIKLRIRHTAAKADTYPQPRRKTWVRWLLWAGGSALGLILLSSAVIAIAISRLDISLLEQPNPTPTYIYDAGGEPVSRFSPSSIDPVSISELPPYIAQAIIAVEDRRFRDHRGVDLIAITRALWRDLKAGQIVEGGSTITQQLAKNLFLSSDQTLTRKLKEAGYAIKIDMHYSKDEIMELYLNHIYFGEGVWGIQNAARLYFDKEARELTLEEAALLAGLPKAPTHYSPWRDEEKAVTRRNVVLSLMKNQGYIDEAEYEAAVATPSGAVPPHSTKLTGDYHAYTNHVIDEAITKYGLTEKDILTGGLQIYTAMDPSVQKAVDEVFANSPSWPQDKEDQIVQGGMVIIDSSTGQIRGMAGQRGDAVYRGFNRATHLKRQPGSAIKPLVVYAPALENGYTPRSLLYDGELDINGYQPQNWDRQYRGEVSLEEALVQSWNIPAVWLLNELGLDTGWQYAQAFGLHLHEQDRKLGLALGGLHEGVSPLQMAQAFSALPNEGVMNEAYAITRITTSQGEVIAEPAPQSTRVVSPEAAYTLTLMLQKAVESGTGQEADLARPVAGKTGTTQLPDLPDFAGITDQAVKDGWFVGYTPELTAAIWVGYDYTDSEHYLTAGSALPAALFAQVMDKALSGTPAREFTAPEHYEEFIKVLEKRDKEEKERRKQEEKERKAKEREQQREERRKEREKQRQEFMDRLGNWFR